MIKKICICLLVSVLITVLACNKIESHIEQGDIAPNFELMDVDSSMHSLAQYRGHKLLLHFWADWCPHCRAEFSELENAYKNLKSVGFKLIAINVGQTREHVLEIQKEYHLTFPLLLDESRALSKKYGVRGLPASYFLNSQGKVEQIVQKWLTETQIKEIVTEL